ncbi:MAG: type II toxin-antitoxin system RelE/ParE family toxin [Geminicoccaceae bacterium]|nr:type II toxin-antitoxin system RelE/ParE family toxin [Geminicoccaceae bacterium]
MKLVWSTRAVAELHDIRRYSVKRWGGSVAISYMRDLRDAAKAAARNPETARPLRGPWKRVRARSHVLVCYLDEPDDRFVIARVLHGAMDIERHLPPDPRS